MDDRSVDVSFFKTAWHAGAAEYGRARAEKYGRIARTFVVLGWFVAAVLVLGIYVAAHGGFGG